MINLIDKDKFNVHILYVKDGIMKQEIIDQRIVFIKLGDKLELKSFVNIKYLFKILRYIKVNNIDIIHTIDPILYFIGATASHFTKIKHIRSQPNFIRKYEKLNAKTLKILPFEKWTNKYITFNNSTKMDLNLAGVPLEKIQTIHSYAKIDELNNVTNLSDIRQEINIAQDTKIICSIGRLVEGKGLETFIKMIPFIIKDYKNVIFLIVGDGPLKEELIKMCEEYGIEKSVYFLGFRTDIPNIVKQITLGVYVTADSAGMIDIPWGHKVLISRQSDIMKEYILDGETGILVNSDKPEDYANIVIRLLQSPEYINVMELKTKEFYSNKFDGNKNMKIFQDLVIKLINNK
nr:glycosyltransferase [Tissierella pigra]